MTETQERYDHPVYRPHLIRSTLLAVLLVAAVFLLLLLVPGVLRHVGIIELPTPQGPRLVVGLGERAGHQRRS